uniref:Uncharacterized protein n=1 Tax=Magnetococcus massalia (strain MO-1) TaxID=451514 RepID=A0A1S7LJT7_MAGMO|nr:protein of unknown function [Candidatus Magnetococcus massalia]
MSHLDVTFVLLLGLFFDLFITGWNFEKFHWLISGFN